MLFPSAWCIVEDFLLVLNANYFLYPLAVGSVGCSIPPASKLGATEVEINFTRFCLDISLLVKSSLIFIWLPHFDMNVKTIERFCKNVSWTFFNEFSLISHQINSFDPPFDRLPPLNMNVEIMKKFCKIVSWTFFNEFDLISHQINSFDHSSDFSDPLSLGQALIDRTEAGRYVIITYEKVMLDKPSFWS